MKTVFGKKCRVIGLLASLSLSGCGVSDESRNNLKWDLQNCWDDIMHHRTPVNDPVLAQVGPLQIRRSYFLNSFKHLSPLDQAHFNTTSRREEYLDRLIRKKMWVAEAERAEIYRDPQYRIETSIMRDGILSEIFRKNVLESDLTVSELDVADYYNGHPRQFLFQDEIVAARIPANSAEDARKIQNLLKSRPNANIHKIIPVALLGASGIMVSTYTIVGEKKTDIEATLLSMKLGQVSPVLSENNQYFLLKKEAEETHPGRTLGESHDEILKKLIRKKEISILTKMKDTYPVTVNKEALASVPWPPNTPANSPKK